MAKIALQLYTIRQETQKDFLGTLEQVAEMGYDGVEFAGYFDTPAAVTHQKLAELGLLPAGTHKGIQLLRADLENEIAYCLEIGCTSIVCPGIFEKTDQASTFMEAAELFTWAGELCQQNGIRFGYHIHSHEFKDVGGKTGMDILLESVPAELMGLQLDTYWVEVGGQNALEYLMTHGERVNSLHFKDMKDRETREDTEVGDGILDIPALVKAAPQFPIDWFIVEQEKFNMPLMESVAISLQNLRELI